MPQKRIFLIHRWGGRSDDVWFPWLKRELEKRGFIVIAPEMPDTETPKIENWVPHLAKLVGEPSEHDSFLGHSVGCHTIVRYLESLPEGTKVAGVVFVGPWLKHVTVGEEEKEIAKPWLEIPIHWAKVKNHAARFIAIFSDDDPYVPADNIDFVKEKLGAEIIVENSKGHFDEATGITELPSALEAVLKMAGPV